MTSLIKWVEVAKDCAKREGKCLGCPQAGGCAFRKYNLEPIDEPIALLVDFILAEIGGEEYE